MCVNLINFKHPFEPEYFPSVQEVQFSTTCRIFLPPYMEPYFIKTLEKSLVGFNISDLRMIPVLKNK